MNTLAGIVITGVAHCAPADLRDSPGYKLGKPLIGVAESPSLQQ